MPYAKEELRRALAVGGFLPYFQPLVDLRSGEVRGFEVLARWQRVRAGLVSPGRFISCIERFGLSNDLTITLLTQAFAAVRTLEDTFGLSINLSATQLHDDTLPDLIARLADRWCFDPRRLTLELTETALVDDLDRAAAVAASLKHLGVHLALDDFGTGYSSLLHLQALPFDEVKIDISFVRHMVEARQSRKITAAVCSLGMSLGMQTVAEGIESPEQARLLLWQGCTLGQGFLYGRPMPAADLPRALEERRHVDVIGSLPPGAMDPLAATDSHPMARLSQLRAIYDSAPVGLAFIDTRLRYVNLNQKLATLNGASIDAHLGRRVSEMVSPALYASFEPYLKRAVAGESFSPLEFPRPEAGAPPSARTVLITYHPVRDESGEVLGACVAIADTTAAKQQERALRESQDHYRHAVELSPHIPWTMSATGDDVSISSRWESLTGFSADATQGLGWLDAVHVDDHARMLSVYSTSMRSGQPIDVDFRLLTRAGVWTWMRSRGRARRNDAGEIVRWYGTLESIDDFKRATEELRRSAAELRTILQSNRAGVVVVEAGTRRIISADERAQELLRIVLTSEMTWAPDTLVGRDARGRRIESAMLPSTRALETGASISAEDIYVTRPDGSEIWLSVSASPIPVDNGRRAGIVLILQDAEVGKEECAGLLRLAYELNNPSSGSSSAGSPEPLGLQSGLTAVPEPAPVSTGPSPASPEARLMSA